MEYTMITIRNKTTGEEKNFQEKQDLADFIDLRGDEDQWEGTDRAGKLPPASRNSDKPANPKPAKVWVDDGRRADESASRHLVDPVSSESASAEAQEEERAEKQAEADALAEEQEAAAEAEEKAQAKGRKATATQATPAKTTKNRK